MNISYEMLGFLTFGFIIFVGFYIRDRKKPKKINNLSKVINQGKFDSINRDNTDTKPYMRFMQEHLTEERQKRVIPFLGIKPDQLQADLELTGMDSSTSVTQIIFSSIIGLIGGLIFGGYGVISYLSTKSNFSIVMITIGGLLFYILKVMPTANIQKQILLRKEEIERRMPEFLELLSSITASGLNISEALNKVCFNSVGVIEREFSKVLLESKLNGGDWRKAMEDMAFKNDIEILSDVISDILISHEKGTPISSVLKQTADTARKLKINAILEKAKKLSVKIIIPMVIFNFLPIMVLFMLPLIWQFTQVMGSS